MAGFNLKAVVTCVDKVSPQLNTMKGKLEKFQKKMNKSGFGKLGLKDAITGVDISAPFVKGVKDAMAYEEVMADIRKIVDFDTPEQFKQMGQDIREMSLTLPMAAKDIGAIVAAGGQTGIPKEDLKQFAEDVIKMGIAFDTSAEEAGSTMVTWRTALNLTQKEVVALSDKINLLSNTQNAKAKDISDVVTRMGTLAATSGVSADKLAALSSTIIATGTNTDQAATGIKNFMLTLTSGKAATANQQKALQQLGFTSTKIAKRMQKDAQGTIMSILESLGKVSKERQSAALTVLFGQESVAAISPLLNNMELLKENFKRVGDSSLYAGSMQKEYESRSNTTANKLQLFNNALTNVSLAIGDALLPVVTELLTQMQPLIVSFGDFIQKHPELVKMVTMAVVGFIGLRVACAGVNFIVGTLSTTLTIFKGVLKGVTLATKLYTFAQIALSNAFKIVRVASIALNAVMAMNPIGLIMTGIAVAATLIITYWNEIVNFFQWLWGVIKPYVMPIIDFFIASFKAGGAAIAKSWETVTKFFNDLWEFIKPYVMPIINVFIEPFKKAGDAIPKMWKSVENFFKELWDKVKSGVQPLIDAWDFLFGDDEKEVKVKFDTINFPKKMSNSMVTNPYYQAPQMPLNNFSNNTKISNSKGELVVKFENAPDGTVVKETKQASGFNTKTDVGWSPYANFRRN